MEVKEWERNITAVSSCFEMLVSSRELMLQNRLLNVGNIAKFLYQVKK